MATVVALAAQRAYDEIARTISASLMEDERPEALEAVLDSLTIRITEDVRRLRAWRDDDGAERES